ncbi:MAG: class I SAM-dependent methyltransferase, partial [Bacteroidota bacterium]
EPKGEIAIYVYKKKAPLREYTDDYIRDRISSLDYNEAMKACEQITALGKKLSEYKMDIDIPAVDILEIKEGTYDVQRFIYHFFMKCFWNNNLSFHDNAVINYDWYHPQNCSRHTLEEVKEWYVNAGLKIVHEFSDFYGITVRGIKL